MTLLLSLNASLLTANILGVDIWALRIADFVKAKCLMNAEVALVLQRKYEQLQQLADDPSSQISQYAFIKNIHIILTMGSSQVVELQADVLNSQMLEILLIHVA